MFNTLEYKRVESDRKMAETEEKLIGDLGFFVVSGIGKAISRFLFGNGKRKKELKTELNQFKKAEKELAKLTRNSQRRKSILGSVVVTGVFAVAGFLITKKVIEK